MWGVRLAVVTSILIVLSLHARADEFLISSDASSTNYLTKRLVVLDKEMVLCGDDDSALRAFDAAKRIAREGEVVAQEFFEDGTCHHDFELTVVLTGWTVDVWDEQEPIAVVSECKVPAMENHLGYLVVRMIAKRSTQ